MSVNFKLVDEYRVVGLALSSPGKTARVKARRNG
jgi:hypothetical protein